MLGPFDQLVGVLLEVDPIESVIGVTQGLDRLVGALHSGVDLHVPPGHPQQSQEEDGNNCDKKENQPVETRQNASIGDGDDGDPAIIHPGVGYRPEISLHV